MIHEFLSHTKPSGKPKDGNGPYYIDQTENYVKYLVEELEKDASLLAWNISTDCLYTSISLANWLLERGITTVGTLQHKSNRNTR